MKCKCKQCGHEWKTRKDKLSVRCPNIKCKSRRWDKEKKIINIGDIYGYFTVLKTSIDENNKNGHLFFLVKCKCGNITTERKCTVISGRKKSCGCLKTELIIKRSKKHGMHKTPEYNSWCGMRSRCNNKKHPHYHDYGGRGIEVCKRWNKFENFYVDMGSKPSIKHSLDRIDNNGNYEPSNTRWATSLEQANNTRINRYITYKGETKTLSQWANYYNINYGTLKRRIKLGWPIEEALTRDIGDKYHDKYAKLELFGTKMSIIEWSRLSPTCHMIFYTRIKNGWPLEQALVFPPMPTGKTYENYLKNIDNYEKHKN
jgi:hypothetical protein